MHRFRVTIALILQASLSAAACSGSDDERPKSQRANGGTKAGGGSNASAGNPGESGGTAGDGGAFDEATGGSAGDVGATNGRAGSGAHGSGGNAGAAGGNSGPESGGSMGGASQLTAGNAAVAGSSTVEPCATPAAPLGALVGWASVPGNNVPVTNGGGDATPVVVTTFAELSAAAAGTVPRVVVLQGTISGSVSIGSNKTLIGRCGGTLKGHLHLSSSSNVIVSNLKIIGYDCTDSPSDCSGGADAVSITKSAHHIWFDHCDISDGSDGNLDITNGSDFVTISYTKFHFSSVRLGGHQFSNLVGAADDVAIDVGRLNVTFHHDWWADNIAEQMPRTRRGKIHLFNNLFTSAGNTYCTKAGFEADVRVENSVYVSVNKPLAPDADCVGLESVDNVFLDTTGNTMGWRAAFVPPYRYTLDPTDGLRTTLEREVGPK